MPARSSPCPSAIARRLSSLRATLRQKSLDGYLTTRRTDQYYLTGFNGEDGAVLILPQHVYLLTDGRFAEEAEREAGWARAILRKGSLADALAKLVGKHRPRSLAFDPSALTVEQWQSFRRVGRGMRWRPVNGLVRQLRIIKDDDEIACIRASARIAEEAFQAVTRGLKPGLTEQRLAADLQYAMMERGASGPSFPIIVAEGPNASRPHAVPGDRRIRVGSAVLIDWGAVYQHYCSDLTRVIFIHRIPPRFRSMYRAVLEAQEAGIAAIRAGVRGSDVDAAARNRLARSGLGSRFTHGLGHGLGLDIHEAPRLSPLGKQPLQAGMVVTVEPGVYLPDLGGIRIEDDVQVTSSGADLLTSLPKDLDAMVV